HRRFRVLISKWCAGGNTTVFLHRRRWPILSHPVRCCRSRQPGKSSVVTNLIILGSKSVQLRNYWLAVVGVLFILVGRLAAQADPEPKNGKVVVPIALKPNDYPKPISRVYLLPECREAIPGNRVQMFLRCFMEQDNFFGRAESEKREKWNQMPLKDLPVAEL